MAASTLQRRTSSDGVVYYASPKLEAAGVRHAFSTRLGGVSPPPFDSLNLGNPSEGDLRDDTQRIEENYRRLQAAIGAAGLERCRVHQVHGGGVVRVRRGSPHDNAVKADALVGDDPGRVLAVRVADCVPILLAAPDGRAVAAVHAGWRGVIADVIGAAVDALASRFAIDPGTLIAAVGPCIGREAFEVGEEVAEAFERALGDDAPIHRRPGAKPRVNLREAIRRQLMRRGVSMEHIDLSDRCCFRDADEFFSHRRESGRTGRMAALILAGK